MKKVIINALKKLKWKIVFQIILIIINVCLLTIPAQIIGNIIDLLYDIEVNKQQVLNNIYYLLGISIALLGIRIIWKHNEIYNVRTLEKEMQVKLFQRFLKLKLANIQKIKNGEIMSHFVKDINEIRSCTFKTLSHGTRIILTFIIAIYKMASGVNIYLTMLIIIPIIIAAYIVVKIKKYVEINFRKAQDRFTELSEYIQESTDSIRTTKAYSCEGEQLKEFIRKNRRVRQSDNTVDVYSNLLSTAIQICFGMCYAISLIFGSRLVLDGEITIGELVTFNGYINLFVNTITWIPGLISQFKRAQIAYRRLDKVFNLEIEKINLQSNIKRNKLDGNIEFKNLTFCYPEVFEKSLEDINIKVKKGQTLGIIGTIGSGKTTLMNLITKLYNVPNGKIIIDGKDINEIPIEVLRDNICYITQDNFLFSTTLKENITLFKEEYENDDIKDSTKKAIVYEDIKTMPSGLETVIGERGGDLSGGQKQRVAISRAFLKASTILIFDDTFSALDNKTSEQLINNIKELSREKTCIIISNKVSDVKHSDEIIVLDDGKIVERGTHEQLVENNGIYQEFYEQQSAETKVNILS